MLLRIADLLQEREKEILAENRADVSEWATKIDEHLMRRLAMDSLKIQQLADGIRSIAKQGEVIKKVSSNRQLLVSLQLPSNPHEKAAQAGVDI